MHCSDCAPCTDRVMVRLFAAMKLEPWQACQAWQARPPGVRRSADLGVPSVLAQYGDAAETTPDAWMRCSAAIAVQESNL